jgi:hypothetical protein
VREGITEIKKEKERQAVKNSKRYRKKKEK